MLELGDDFVKYAWETLVFDFDDEDEHEESLLVQRKIQNECSEKSN
jgi:hypothetical protein